MRALFAARDGDFLTAFKTETGPVYGLTLTNHLMIAHRMRGERFGPAQRQHGATFAVEVTLFAERLDADGVVADMGRAAEVLAAILAPLDYRDLDELPRFAGRNTTTEVMAAAIHADLCAALRNGDLGSEEAGRIRMVRVVLRENPQAWASFEAPFCP